MPTALMLTLRPTAPATIAPHVGRAAHAAFLRAVSERDSALADRLHAGDGIKPFAVSDLLGVRPGREGRSVTPDQTYHLRWSGLTSELDDLLRSWAAEPPASIVLHDTTFAIEAATTDSAVHLWAGTATWNDLAALDQIGRTAPPSRLSVLFHSPTTFRSSGRNIPLPLPDLIFGSLLDRWNSVAPLALPSEVRRFAQDCLLVGRYSLDCGWHPLFEGGETAFTGRCSYTVTNRDRYYLHCCGALLRLGFFSGVGAKTGMGFGMMRWLPSEKPVPA